jgi:GGDEF domain-containing protein
VSVGVAVSPDDGLGIYDLLRAADRRMYTVKRSRV